MADHLPDAGKMVDLDRLQALHEAATPGPWVREWNNNDEPDAGIDIMHHGSGGRVALVEFMESSDAMPIDEDYKAARDADLIVAMRNALPALLAEVRALRAEHEKTEAALRGFCDKVAEPKFNRYGLVVEQQKDGTYSRVRDIVRTDMGNLWREPKETTNG